MEPITITGQCAALLFALLMIEECPIEPTISEKWGPQPSARCMMVTQGQMNHLREHCMTSDRAALKAMEQTSDE